MNSYGLRIKASESKNNSSGMSFKPVTIPYVYKFDKHELCKSFRNLTAEEQVAAVKKLLNNVKESYHDDVVEFLVITYLCAENKHPIKCMIMRFVTKNPFIQGSFTEHLTRHLLQLSNEVLEDYKDYVKVVSKIACCIENFPVGAVAFKTVEVKLATFLEKCLICCVTSLSNDRLTPTGRNEVFGLSHTVLRLLLYVIQKIDMDSIDVNLMFTEIRSCLKQLLFNDSPMDTKSVCGILLVSMHIVENGDNSWVDILTSNNQNMYLQEVLLNDSCKLSLLSAIATVISMDELHTVYIDGVPAIITLTNDILDLGDRYSSESTFTLGISRTIVQISKGLEVFGESGLHLLDKLCVFVWSHLEHSTDSVQHLSAQILTNIIKFCSHLKKQGNDSAMTKLFSTLSSLERTRKSFYLSLTAITSEVGFDCVRGVWPDIIEDTLNVLHLQAVQASATTSLETLLRHTHTDTRGIHTQWVEPVLRCVRGGAGAVNILTSLLILIVKKDGGVVDYMLPYIRKASESPDSHELVCALMLLSVVRQTGHLPGGDGGGLWREVISYDALRTTAVHTNDEIRFLTLSLMVESPKSSEVFTAGELDIILWFLSYNINDQSPHFKQLVLSLMKKEALSGGDGRQGDYYSEFLDRLTDQCFESLIPGGNHNRRHAALQILLWIEKLQLEGTLRHLVTSNEANAGTPPDRVSLLLDALADSYESNKDMALRLLYGCPSEVIYRAEHAATLNLESVMRQASSVKPTECVTAAYKLRLLATKPTKQIGEDCETAGEVSFRLLRVLLAQVEQQLAVCEADLALGARHAPLYGLLHCVGTALHLLDEGSWSPAFTCMCESLVAVCASVCACTAPVLNSAAPEGHMPHADGGKIRLEDGSEVTAQMVLLCAWRSVKEVSWILSLIVAKMTACPEVGRKVALVQNIGDTFLQLLTDIKHRGAFEQVYVGFSRVLSCLWRDQEPALNQLPRRWLTSLMTDIESGHGTSRVCETRRSAGLPFMIQALVVSELQVCPGSFPGCIWSLLRAARSSSLATRCHAMNILRALYRSSALGGATEAAGGGAGTALQLAIQACESDAWIERNSATLLFSALMVRVFGVQRSRDSEHLCLRNRMTGRIFFLRYPLLYDFMLNKLQEASAVDTLHPALYPVLLLLARLYPSALEGSVSILKLVSFVPGVLVCGRGPALHVRQLAARALTPLIPHTQYLAQLEALFTSLSDPRAKRNFIHGTLLQIIKLLDSFPDSVSIDAEAGARFMVLIQRGSWILEQSESQTPCYVIIDEFIKLVHIVLWKFPSLMEKNHLSYIQSRLTKLLFDEIQCTITPGRELCLADAVHLLLIMNGHGDCGDVSRSLYACLTHQTYEVVLAALNYILIVHEMLEPENTLHEHIQRTRNTRVLDALRTDPEYIRVLCKVLKNSRYLECIQKCLTALTLEPDTQRHIVRTKSGEGDVSDDVILTSYFDYIENEHENFIHIYLKGLAKFLEDKLQTTEHTKILEAVRIMFRCSLSDNSEDTRAVVVEFIQKNLERLMTKHYDELDEADQFELRATVWSTCVALLEDDDSRTRTLTAHTLTRYCDVTRTHRHVLPARARDFLLHHIQTRETHGLALLAVLALLSFHCEVSYTDELADESRVFDHNEKYNTHLEETVWAVACGDVINDMHPHADVRRRLCDVIEDRSYRQTFRALCRDNVETYRRMVEADEYTCDGNQKVEAFVKRLTRR
ncbi:tRNA (32-2'-O)-methyltransferase regulator THADA isoform X2 [Danaus plexippus]|uniref:tRNA (32-2'-O)-methyltransferase regulator THADA isoform X2 n=1 Tax=Danaus plexippus TaxID=13037 RepID=UPI002AB08AE3|nr:tRNA (32-2'-O)-methyltransferase regulator THADA isoform X2 [Danaus plexippus]